MIYPKNFEQKLGFDQVKEHLKERCVSPLGAANVDKMRFTANKERLQTLIGQVNECKEILAYEGGFPTQDYYDLTDELRRIKIPGTFISVERLNELKLSLTVIHKIYSFFSDKAEDRYPSLQSLAWHLDFDETIIRDIEGIIDEKGEVRDKASSKLLDIRRDIRKKRQSVDSTLQKNLREAKRQGWAKEEAAPTLRNGRSVIPVPSTHKRQVRGFIHDESSTGQTVYIEPTEVFELNNAIRELQAAEYREIVRILTVFSDKLRENIDDYLALYHYLGIFDFVMAKARYAIETDSNKPQTTDQPYIYLEEAYHPLLLLSHKKHDKPVVPLNLKLDKKERVLVITGPNAGGKSVCLKTVGLIQYMYQCGMLVPANENTVLGVFSDIFVNIGDEQSLENDLSTYSSHLTHLNQFVRRVRSTSLFLVDELGTGTEPQIGGAIAEAVLEALNEKKAFGVVTTHYAILKKAADENEGMVNGAMLFDKKKMEPTFILKTGKPGSSFAFEIAEQIGMPKSILKKAEKKTDKSQVDFEKQLQELETEKREVEKKKQEFKVADDFLAEMIDKYERLNKELESTKKEEDKKARQEAKNIVASANKLIENTIREIKEAGAEKQKTRQIRKNFEEKSKQLIPEEEKPVEPKQKKEAPENEKPLKKGDYVKLKGQDAIGEITAINKNQVTIAFDSFNFTTETDKVERVNKPSKQSSSKKSGRHNQIMDDINEKVSRFNTTLDVRGKKAEEVARITKEYIDEAILLSIPEVEIIHGKGEGILRSVVRDTLNQIKEVQSFQDRHADQGGHGVTIVKLK